MSEPQTVQVPVWTLGWRMQRSLAHAGIGIDDISEELGVSRSTVSRWVNDHARPRIGYLKLWAMRCGVPLPWLVDGVDDEEGSRTVLLWTPDQAAA